MEWNFHYEKKFFLDDTKMLVFKREGETNGCGRDLSVSMQSFFESDRFLQNDPTRHMDNDPCGLFIVCPCVWIRQLGTLHGLRDEAASAASAAMTRLFEREYKAPSSNQQPVPYSFRRPPRPPEAGADTDGDIRRYRAVI